VGPGGQPALDGGGEAGEVSRVGEVGVQQHLARTGCGAAGALREF